PVPLIHVWHEDIGFRRSAVLNLAISKASGDYIIQLDGDCIIHKKFIEDHITSVEKNCYLYGSRVSLKENISPVLFKDKIITFTFYSSVFSKWNRIIFMPSIGFIMYS